MLILYDVMVHLSGYTGVIRSYNVDILASACALCCRPLRYCTENASVLVSDLDAENQCLFKCEFRVTWHKVLMAAESDIVIQIIANPTLRKFFK